MAPLLVTRTVLVLALLTSGCAAADRVARVAGPVEWKVVDVGRVSFIDGNRSRWSYTIVLRETAKSTLWRWCARDGRRHPLVEPPRVERPVRMLIVAAHAHLLCVLRVACGVPFS
jgi:hypothetical protein